MSGSAVAVSAATQTVYPIMINGYLCFTAAEVATARVGTNPFKTAAATTTKAAATVHASAAAARTATTTTTTTTTTYAGSARKTGPRGTLVDIYA